MCVVGKYNPGEQLVGSAADFLPATPCETFKYAPRCYSITHHFRRALYSSDMSSPTDSSGQAPAKKRFRLKVSTAEKLIFLHENHGNKSNDAAAMVDLSSDK